MLRSPTNSPRVSHTATSACPILVYLYPNSPLSLPKAGMCHPRRHQKTSKDATTTKDPKGYHQVPALFLQSALKHSGQPLPLWNVEREMMQGKQREEQQQHHHPFLPRLSDANSQDQGPAPLCRHSLHRLSNRTQPGAGLLPHHLGTAPNHYHTSTSTHHK